MAHLHPLPVPVSLPCQSPTDLFFHKNFHNCFTIFSFLLLTRVNLWAFSSLVQPLCEWGGADPTDLIYNNILGFNAEILLP